MPFFDTQPPPRPAYVQEWMMPPEARDPWPDSNVAALRGMCQRLGIDPRDLVAVMANESGCLPDPPHRGPARGLIQFEPDTLRGLGWRGSSDEFARQDVAAQLDYVERYYTPYARAGLLRGLGTLYTATFLPALLRGAVNPSFVLCGRDGPLEWAYRANRGFDVAKKGTITVQDLVVAARAAAERSGQAQRILAEIERQESEPAPQPLVQNEDLEIPGMTVPYEDEEAG